MAFLQFRTVSNKTRKHRQRTFLLWAFFASTSFSLNIEFHFELEKVKRNRLAFHLFFSVFPILPGKGRQKSLINEKGFYAPSDYSTMSLD